THRCLDVSLPIQRRRFTYTTLFRSIGEALGVLQRKARISSRPRAYATRKKRLHGEVATLSRLGSLEVAVVSSRALRDSWAVLEQIGRAHVNSSHVSISYAVFCLKKKKKILSPIVIRAWRSSYVMLLFQSKMCSICVSTTAVSILS